MEINYDQLAAIKRDIEFIIANSPALGLFLRPHITKFFQRNAMRLQILQDRLGAMQQKCIEMDADGQPIMKKNLEGRNEWVFRQPTQSIMKDMQREGVKTVADLYYKESSEFLAITFEIEA